MQNGPRRIPTITFLLLYIGKNIRRYTASTNQSNTEVWNIKTILQPET